ncbi:hypothetical protein HRG84_13595 [Flavisolibacter sp. BT320]|nr:hypothetical protein [Flavisolibacter longurius]
MKLFKILSHPYTLILSFLFILISGQHLGGFYVMYIFLGLTHGVVHSVLGFLGMIVLAATHHSAWSRTSPLRQILNVTGVGLLFVSLYLFFMNDKQHYNWGTFYESIPLATLFFTGFIALCFLIGNFWQPHLKSDTRQGILSKV